ncbi:hypothetical protein, partial [Ruminococcus sp. TM463]|uniref:hypothetical protein n=1 Tax=Ruminococcus sp. TM463 TaxID=2883190 RepID=UPI0022387D62
PTLLRVVAVFFYCAFFYSPFCDRLTDTAPLYRYFSDPTPLSAPPLLTFPPQCSIIKKDELITTSQMTPPEEENEYE